MVMALTIMPVLALATVLWELRRRSGSWVTVHSGGIVCPGSVPVSLGTTRGTSRIWPHV